MARRAAVDLGLFYFVFFAAAGICTLHPFQIGLGGSSLVWRLQCIDSQSGLSFP
jgi:hypothetical protein